MVQSAGLQNKPTASLQKGKITPNEWPSWLGLQNTSTASLLRDKTTPNDWPSWQEPQNTLTASLLRGPTTPNEYEQVDSKAPVMLELWGMQSNLLLPSLLGSLWSGVVTPDRVLYKGQIELDFVLMLHWITWNRIVYVYTHGFGIK